MEPLRSLSLPSTISSSTAPSALLQNNIERLKEAVLDRRPALREIIRTQGKQSLFSYMRSYMGKSFSCVSMQRQESLIRVFSKEVATRLGDDVAVSVAQQLKKYYVASTTDHFSPMYHPWVLNYNLISAGVFAESADTTLQNVITLACANVSLNNSYFPRGFAFNTEESGSLQLQRMSFFPCSVRPCPVYGFRPYTLQDVQRMQSTVDAQCKQGEISSKEAQGIKNILSEVYAAPDVLACDSYSDQITKTNFVLWKKLVPKGKGKAINFVYLEQEWLTARLLMEEHLTHGTVLYDLIFGKDADTLLEIYFEDLPYAFCRKEKYGTHLFWALIKGAKPRRVQLWKNGNRLESDDGSYSIELTPEAIKLALERKELVPNLLLTCLTLCCYYGLSCLGGMGQINYLTAFKEAYMRMQKERNYPEDAEICRDVPTQNLGGEVAVAFLQGALGDLAPATTFDILLHGDSNSWSKIVAESKQVTLEDAVSTMIPEDYPGVYSLEEREPILSAITSKDLTNFLKMEGRINASIAMPPMAHTPRQAIAAANEAAVALPTTNLGQAKLCL